MEVSAAIASAAGTNDARTISALTHQILQALHVWEVEQGPDGRDWRAELEGLADLAEEAGKTPVDIMGCLRVLAVQFGPRSGNVNADHVREQLARFEIYLSPETTGVRRSAAYNTTINARDHSTVFNARIQHFGPVNINSTPPAQGEESGAS